MDARLNGILTTMAQQYAFPILHNAPMDESRFAYLANGLASYGLLVIVSDVPENSYELLVRTWVESYYKLYDLLTTNIFPSFTRVNLGMADGLRPPVVVFQGESTAVIQMLAGYVVPYVAMRQQSRSVSDAEIRGLMTYILDDLQADDIGTEKYNTIMREGARIISQLITMPMQQFALTSMRKPLFQQVHVQPQPLPLQQKPQPVPPPSVPEAKKAEAKADENTTKPKTATQEAKAAAGASQAMPIWFNGRRGNIGRLPPVPLLPVNEDD
jgi:hypothetical protein